MCPSQAIRFILPCYAILNCAWCVALLLIASIVGRLSPGHNHGRGQVPIHYMESRHMRCILASLLACSSVLLAAGIASAETCTPVNTGQLHISLPFNGGPNCVALIPARKKLCVPGATRVADISVQIIYEYNAQRPSTFSSPEEPGCFYLGLSSRTANHAGAYPNYRCSPGELRAVVHAKLCTGP